jgi:translation initiation factor IF-2
VEHKGKRIVFIDTPGHEAFTQMRSHGAKVTDIVILVVAADDGVMPQTLEAMDHAKAAKVPIIVAVNKIDKPNAEPDRVKQQLADRGLLPEEWGGDTVMVPVSAKTQQNLDLLLEMILLVSDMKELKANPARPAVGTVLEAKLDRGRGPVATVLVQDGTLSVGDNLLAGPVVGKVRALIDDRGEKIEEAPPSSAVLVLGLEGLPEPGDGLQVITDIERARKTVEFREQKARELAMAKPSRLSLEQFQAKLASGEVKELPILLKCDVQGSLEVLTDSVGKLQNDKVKVRLIRAGVGAISRSDVLLAAVDNAVIIGFNVRPERNAALLAEQEGIEIRLHTVIYELVDELKKAMAGLLEPIIKETFQGRADVQQAFRVSKVGTVAGCVVQEGRITRGSLIRLLRDNVVVYTGKVSSLRRFKDEASEVRAGQECGIGLENYNDIKPGDQLEAFSTEKIAQELVV